VDLGGKPDRLKQNRTVALYVSKRTTDALAPKLEDLLRQFRRLGHFGLKAGSGDLKAVHAVN
jgi:hypothetical protein